MAKKSVHLTVITPSHAVFDEDAVSVVVPAFDGALGVLPGHAPLMSLLGNGTLTVKVPDGDAKIFAIRGGFLQVTHNKLTILTPEANGPDEIKAEDVQADLEKWENTKAVTDEECETKEQALNWAKARQHLLTQAK